MNKNVLIVNFNTQKLTDACIKSVNKHTPGCSIYVFDNSDKEPFVNTFDNVTVFDNTEGKIVNFDEILEKHAERFETGAKANNFGSVKHCLSIEKCLTLIPDGFVLLDSDVLIKKDFSNLYDEKYIFVGSIEKMKRFKPRVAPFIVFINSRMCNENGIHYFDEQHMFGFKTNETSDKYDTGCWFYETTEGHDKKIISYNSYIEHYRAGSWLKDAREKHNYKRVDPDVWLNRYKRYWDDTVVRERKITISRTKESITKPSKPRRPERMVSAVKVKSSARIIGLIKR